MRTETSGEKGEKFDKSGLYIERYSYLIFKTQCSKILEITRVTWKESSATDLHSPVRPTP